MSPEPFPSARSAGYRMPAEWEPHERCWMAWPCRLDVWGDHFPATQKNFAEVANAIAAFEPVTMLAPPKHVPAARNLCSSAVEILAIDIDDSWMRDSGPNFVVDDAGRLAASIFQFNAWGQKHSPWGKDAALGHRIAEHLGIPTFTATVFMEGGGINVDGQGTVLTTEQCILHANRNPGLAKKEAETVLCDALGASRVIWLPGDPEDFETDGHVDGIACFIEPGKALVEVCPTVSSPRYDNLQANLEAVREATDNQGRRLEVFTIEESQEAWEAHPDCDIFCSSYINFYIANGGIVMPGFGVDSDQDARAIVEFLFPDREVVQLDISDIAVGGGGIHCITQQQPRGET